LLLLVEEEVRQMRQVEVAQAVLEPQQVLQYLVVRPLQSRLVMVVPVVSIQVLVAALVDQTDQILFFLQ
jgi:hypothetical protein